jgi:hypothetical protein
MIAAKFAIPTGSIAAVAGIYTYSRQPKLNGKSTLLLRNDFSKAFSTAAIGSLPGPFGEVHVIMLLFEGNV